MPEMYALLHIQLGCYDTTSAGMVHSGANSPYMKVSIMGRVMLTARRSVQSFIIIACLRTEVLTAWALLV